MPKPEQKASDRCEQVEVGGASLTSNSLLASSIGAPCRTARASWTCAAVESRNCVMRNIVYSVVQYGMVRYGMLSIL